MGTDSLRLEHVWRGMRISLCGRHPVSNLDFATSVRIGASLSFGVPSPPWLARVCREATPAASNVSSSSPALGPARDRAGPRSHFRLPGLDRQYSLSGFSPCRSRSCGSGFSASPEGEIVYVRAPAGGVSRRSRSWSPRGQQPASRGPRRLRRPFSCSKPGFPSWP